MTRDDKIKTLKLHLDGLYENEAEIESFLENRPRLDLNALKLNWLWKLYYRQGRHKNKQILPVLKKIQAIRSDFQNCRGSIRRARENTKYLLRVDDFPHWSVGSDTFRKFLEILQKDEIPFLLGVTPFLSLDYHNPENRDFRGLTAEEVSLLDNPLIEIALHGFTHQTREPKFHSEFVGLSTAETEDYIKKALEKLQGYGLKTDAFIPPYNTIDLHNYEALKKYFRIICGGPATVKYFGLVISPISISGSLYIPSYRPLSTTAAKIADFLETAKPTGILPITLHWAGEATNDFAGVKKLAGLIKGGALHWKTLL